MNAVKIALVAGAGYLLLRTFSNPSAGSISAPASQANNAGSVQLEDDNGTSAFKAGDTWTLTVRGPASAPVMISATQNGQVVGTSQLGTTDANGVLVVKGNWVGANAGAWVEQITVGGQSLPALSFSVGVAGLGQLEQRTSDGKGGYLTRQVERRRPQFTVADLRSALQRGGGAAVSAAARSRTHPRPLGLPVLLVRGADGQVRPVLALPGGGYR